MHISIVDAVSVDPVDQRNQVEAPVKRQFAGVLATIDRGEFRQLEVSIPRLLRSVVCEPVLIAGLTAHMNLHFSSQFLLLIILVEVEFLK